MFDSIRRLFRKSSPRAERDAQRIRRQLARCACGHDEAEVQAYPVRYEYVLIPAPVLAYPASRHDVRRLSGGRKSADESSWAEHSKMKEAVQISKVEVCSEAEDNVDVGSRTRAPTGDSGYFSLGPKNESSRRPKRQTAAKHVVSDQAAGGGEYDIGESDYLHWGDGSWAKGNNDVDFMRHHKVDVMDSGEIDSVIETWLNDLVGRSPALEFPRVWKKEPSFRDWDDILNRGIDDGHPSRIAATRRLGGTSPDFMDESWVEG
ncbi:hypothetical protein PFICI_00603 [Pestalotiopsis fici W106-1]|uniref:Uncharacterized protein n=1 Tax=Pestalotiopsis fici (strain W106-1 / CGMCC3.15140) TaxID=1229662 RepID=W3XLC5_PESFW|nr:uncharacterized protein PFICI_00603 [Pestalotiopsis fici W106-1]ETS86775.1 hypothetical protein PFICI_00603 [Pestalotiopsis fici W106-1]